ncbi:MAG: hypothetical protein R6T90_06685, partial [Dissulfuribacterales bacterium]
MITAPNIRIRHKSVFQIHSHGDDLHFIRVYSKFQGFLLQGPADYGQNPAFMNHLFLETGKHSALQGIHVSAVGSADNRNLFAGQSQGDTGCEALYISRLTRSVKERLEIKLVL